MEKKERTKYYNIGLKDKKLHNEFMIFGRTIESKNVDDTIEYLLYHETLSKSFTMDGLKRLCKYSRVNETYDELLKRVLDEYDELKEEKKELE
jgi:hypothetical protein